MGVIARAFRLLRQAGRGRFTDRVRVALDVRLDRYLARTPEYPVTTWLQVRDRLTEVLGGDAESILNEAALAALEGPLQAGLERLRGEAGFLIPYAADLLLGRCCYLVGRLIRPAIAVETGVAAGVTSAYLLAALQENGRGELHSVDLPPPEQGADERVGSLIPDRLRPRWHLHRGSSRRELPGLLRQLGAIDLFVHDSLHTLRNMRWEFRIAWEHLRPGGALISDDIEQNQAFDELRSCNPRLWAAIPQQSKPDTRVGVALRST